MTDIFKRTDAGLSNKHLFHGVDYVVYVEGGGERNVDEVTIDRSFDELYWAVVFRVFAPVECKFKFQCYGAKNNLIAIANQIRKGTISNAMVAMDRDYGDFDGRNPSGDMIFYTRGYSWENDVWDVDLCVRLFRVICPLSDDNPGILVRVEEAFSAFNRDSRYLAVADAALCSAGLPILAKKHEREFISVDSDHFPYLNLRQFRIRLNETRRRRKGERLCCKFKKRVRGAMDVRGKFVASYAIHLINGLLRVHGTREKVGSTTATALALNQFENVLRNEGENQQLSSYFAAFFSHLKPAPVD